MAGGQAAAEHPTMPRTAPAQRTTQPICQQCPRLTHLPWVVPEADTHTHVRSQGLVRGSSGYPHVKARETEAQVKWLVQDHTKWSLPPVCALSSLITSCVLLDREPCKASQELQ